jgi:endonuclease YncB( thermonuclease family)
MDFLAGGRRAAEAAACCLFLVGCGDPLDRLAEGERGRVAAAFAGGRLELEDGSVVRLAGVDVPGRDESGGAEAHRLLRELTEGRPVALLYSGPGRDGFGRAVAHVRTAERRRWVEGALLDAGLARVRTSRDDRALAPEMLAREARARAAGRGAWSHPSWRVRLPAEAQAGFILVEGRVGRLEPARGGYRVGFSAPGLSLAVTRTAALDLRAAGMSVESLGGRLLRVRGVARPAFGGFVLKIDHPEQVELLTER